MAKQSDFNAFLSNIEPSASTVTYISSIQNNLRSFLKNHKDYKNVHTGYEARTAGCLRGYFEDSDEGPNGKRESTSYTGSHSVQCFIIKRGICVARSKEFIINIR